MIRAIVEFELSGRGNGWTDVSEDVHRASEIQWQRGITGTGPAARVAPPGLLTFSLRNDEENSAKLLGYYSPGHANCRAGFRKTAGVRFSLRIRTASYKQEVLDDSPHTYWRFNEAAGQLTTVDEMGGHDVTLPSSHVTLGVAGAIADGSTGLSTDGSQAAASIASPFTSGVACAFEFWFKPRDVSQTYNGIIGASGGGNGLYYDGVNRKVLLNTPLGDFRNGTAMTTGDLYHVVVSIDDAGRASFYVNGLPDGTSDAGWAGNTINALLTLGGGALMCDLFDEVAFYSHSLAADRVAAHYARRTSALLYYPQDIVQFVGELRIIRAEAGIYSKRLTYCQAVDWMLHPGRYYANQIPMQKDITDDDVFSLLVGGIPVQPVALEVHTGYDLYPYAFYNAQQSTITSEFQKLAMSSLSRIYVQRDGTLTYETRDVRAKRRSTTSLYLTAADWTEDRPIEVDDNQEDRLTKVQVQVHQPFVDAEVVLYALETPVEIQPGNAVALRGLFTRPGQEAFRAGGLDMLDPVATTDFVGNAQQDGLGADLTDKLTVDATFLATSVLFTITASQPLWLTKLQARGKGVYDKANTVVEASVADLGGDPENATSLDMPYQPDPAVGIEMAQYALHMSEQSIRRARKVPVRLPDENPTRARAFAVREISDRVQITEAMTALPINPRESYFINSTRGSVSADGVVFVEWEVEPADTTSYWFLEVVGRSELEQTTVPAFGIVIGHDDIPHTDEHGDVDHDDVPHVDDHTDDHADTHTDADHADGYHGDSHTDTHGDVAHSDVEHIDEHSDATHQDGTHSDSHSDITHVNTHTDEPHTNTHSDVPHSDGHSDEPYHNDGGEVQPHIDIHGDHDDSSHTDISHVDQHGDVAHSDTHGDSPHGDSHTDSHSDVPHSDVNHTDTHSDVTHVDDTDHDDLPHADEHVDDHDDVPHSDSLHTDVAHTDTHEDIEHLDTA